MSLCSLLVASPLSLAVGTIYSNLHVLKVSLNTNKQTIDEHLNLSDYITADLVSIFPIYQKKFEVIVTIYFLCACKNS